MGFKDAYRKARKRIRDKFYRARKKGMNVSAKDLPDIPKEPTLQDIYELEEEASYILSEEQGKAQEDEIKYAEPDETAFFSIIQEIAERLYEKFSSDVYGGLWLQKTGGYLIRGRGKNAIALPYDTSDDQNELINRWKQVVDDNTQDYDSAIALERYFEQHEEEISEILYNIMVIYYREEDYNRAVGRLMNIISYNIPFTREDNRNIENAYNSPVDLGDVDFINMPMPDLD